MTEFKIPSSNQLVPLNYLNLLSVISKGSACISEANFISQSDSFVDYSRDDIEVDFIC